MTKGTFFLRIFCLLALLWPGLAVNAIAQIQLSPPPVKTQGTDAQLALPVPGQEQQSGTGEQNAPQNGANGQQGQTQQPDQTQQASPQNAEPPDMTLVNEATGVEADEMLKDWAERLNKLEEMLNTAASISYELLDETRTKADKVRDEIDEFLAVLQPKVKEAEEQLENLGKVPDGGEPPQVASQRDEMQRIYGSLTATANVAESIRLRATQLITRIQEIRREKFAKRLFERVPETHSLRTWESAPSQFLVAFQQVGQEIATWWSGTERKAEAIQLLALALLIAIGTNFLAVRGVRRFRAWNEPGEPPYWRRSTSAAWVILLRLLPYAATFSFFYYSFRAQGLFSENLDVLAYSAGRAILIVAAVSALITTVLAPRRRFWRLLPVDDRAARRIRWLVIALAVIYGFTLFIGTIRDVFQSPFTLTVAQGFVSSIAIALLVMAILLTQRNARPIQDAPEFVWLDRLRWPVWGLAILILVTALTGFTGLSGFLSAQLIVSGTILSVLYLLMVWVDAVGESMASDEVPLGQFLQNRLGLDKRRREQLSLPVTFLLKTAALIVTVPLVLLQLGFDRGDIWLWAETLFFGFKIGQTEISIFGIIAAILVFVIGYLVARLFQSWLDRRVLETAGIATGTRHSISTAVGYAGIIVAGLVAISYAGLDLSNIALVAGALSVGIGLGLQGVVNNFVSGLILLAERPIKVGDWVIVGGEEGFVKKISVRATEIETFNRSNVIIPNSMFISEKVENWTLHNYSGRISIDVSVHYRSDPRQVRDMLLEVARSNPIIMKTPEPYVYFRDFGADALEFTLYAFTYDITRSFGLKTEMRIEIFEALREAGVEIPYRQTDVHFRDAEWLKDLLGRQPQPLANGAADMPAEQPTRQPRARRFSRKAPPRPKEPRRTTIQGEAGESTGAGNGGGQDS